MSLSVKQYAKARFLALQEIVTLLEALPLDGDVDSKAIYEIINKANLLTEKQKQYYQGIEHPDLSQPCEAVDCLTINIHLRKNLLTILNQNPPQSIKTAVHSSLILLSRYWTIQAYDMEFMQNDTSSDEWIADAMGRLYPIELYPQLKNLGYTPDSRTKFHPLDLDFMEYRYRLNHPLKYGCDLVYSKKFFKGFFSCRQGDYAIGIFLASLFASVLFLLTQQEWLIDCFRFVGIHVVEKQLSLPITVISFLIAVLALTIGSLCVTFSGFLCDLFYLAFPKPKVSQYTHELLNSIEENAKKTEHSEESQALNSLSTTPNFGLEINFYPPKRQALAKLCNYRPWVSLKPFQQST